MNEQVFALTPLTRYLDSTRTDVRPPVGASGEEMPKESPDGRGPQREAEADPDLHRRQPARPGLSPISARDRPGGGVGLLGHRPHPPGRAPARGLPDPGPEQAPGHPGP